MEKIGIASFLFGIIIMFYTCYFSKPIDSNKLTHVTGKFDHYEISEGRYSTGKIYLSDKSFYAVQSIVIPSFDRQNFIKNVKKGDTVNMLIDDKTNFKYKDVYMIESDGKIYMSFEDSTESQKSNQIVGIILGSVFAITGFAFFIKVHKQTLNKNNVYLSHKNRITKDYFNGNIKNPKELFIGLLLVAIIFFGIAIFFLLVALFYDNCEYGTRILLILFSALSFILSVGYPIITIYTVKNRKKYPRLVKLLVQPDRFTNGR